MREKLQSYAGMSEVEKQARREQKREEARAEFIAERQAELARVPKPEEHERLIQEKLKKQFPEGQSIEEHVTTLKRGMVDLSDAMLRVRPVAFRADAKASRALMEIDAIRVDYDLMVQRAIQASEETRDIAKGIAKRGDRADKRATRRFWLAVIGACIAGFVTWVTNQRTVENAQRQTPSVAAPASRE